MKNIVEMMIDGKPVRKVSFQGKTYLPVVLNKRFSLKLRNNSNKRTLAVISVDGVNVLDGTDATSDGNGYVIAPWCSINIQGWRNNMEEVATFVVGRKEKSYAAKTGRPNNVGVIGVAFYDENIRHTIPQPPLPQPDVWENIHPIPLKWVGTNEYNNTLPSYGYEREEFTSGGIVLPDVTMKARCMSNTPSASSCCGGSMSRSSKVPAAIPASLGTCYGDTINSSVREVSFEKAISSKTVVVLYYDSVEALRAKGVPVEVDIPNPFPGEPERFFCPPPPR